MKKELEQLTKRQKSIFRFIARFVKSKGYPPTVRDIGKGVGLSSSSTVHFHLNSLEEMGLIKRDPSKPRAIKILLTTDKDVEEKGLHVFPEPVEQKIPQEPGEQGNSETPVEVTGQVSPAKEANTPEEAAETAKSFNIVEYPLMKGYENGKNFFDENNIETILPLPTELVDKEEGFILRMMGNSMEGVGILDGDLCIFHKTDEIKEGEIASVISNNELTIKRVFGHMGLYRLDPENRRMNPVYVKEIKILGKLTGVIRSFPGRKE